MDKQTQKERLLKLFADNGNILSLGQIMKTDLAAEYRARISELRNERHEILCVVDKKEPSNNLYTYYGIKEEIDLKAHISPVEPVKENAGNSTGTCIEIKNRHISEETTDKIEQYRKLQRTYPENHIQYQKIGEQIERLKR